MEDKVDFVYLAILIREVLDLLDVLVIQGDAVLLTQGHVLGDGDGPVPGNVRLVKHGTERYKQGPVIIKYTVSSTKFCTIVLSFYCDFLCNDGHHFWTEILSSKECLQPRQELRSCLTVEILSLRKDRCFHHNDILIAC